MGDWQGSYRQGQDKVEDFSMIKLIIFKDFYKNICLHNLKNPADYAILRGRQQKLWKICTQKYLHLLFTSRIFDPILLRHYRTFVFKTSQFFSRYFFCDFLGILNSLESKKTWNSSTFWGIWPVFKYFSRQMMFSSTFQDKWCFQGLF